MITRTTTELYGGEVLLDKVVEGRKHWYEGTDKKKKKDKEFVDGVTGATSSIDKPALVGWAAKVTAQHVADTLVPGEALDEVQIQQLVDDAKNARYGKTKGAADLGTMAHSWVEDYLKGKKPKAPINEMLKNAVNAFLRWEKEVKLKVLSSERMVYSRKYGYAGTMDILGKVNGVVCIVDIKTGNAIYDEARFQTAAYQQAVQEEDGKKYGNRWIVRLGKEKPDFEAVEVPDFQKDFKAFLGALVITRRQKELKKPRE